MSDKEAVDTVAHILTGLCNAVCCHKTGGKIELPNCECRQTARLVIEAARPHIRDKMREEIAQDAIERAEIYEQSMRDTTPGYKDAAIALRAFAAAIRAAKDVEK